MRKKWMKKGIAAVLACTMLIGTYSMASANNAAENKAAEDVEKIRQVC